MGNQYEPQAPLTQRDHLLRALPVLVVLVGVLGFAVGDPLAGVLFLVAGAAWLAVTR